MLSGSTADRLGSRRVFQAGLALFLLGSLLCALAPSLELLVAFRVLQAIGGAMPSPVAVSIVRNVFEDPRERAQAIGVFAAMFGISMALGPVLGGFLVSAISWRALSGRLVGRFGARPSTLAGGLAVLASGLMLTGLAPGTSVPFLLSAYAVFGFGFALVSPPIANTAVSGMPLAALGYLTTTGWARDTARRTAKRLEEPDLCDHEPRERAVGAPSRL
jgi:MFS family permease